MGVVALGKVPWGRIYDYCSEPALRRFLLCRERIVTRSGGARKKVSGGSSKFLQNATANCDHSNVRRSRSDRNGFPAAGPPFTPLAAQGTLNWH